MGCQGARVSKLPHLLCGELKYGLRQQVTTISGRLCPAIAPAEMFRKVIGHGAKSGRCVFNQRLKKFAELAHSLVFASGYLRRSLSALRSSKRGLVTDFSRLSFPFSSSYIRAGAFSGHRLDPCCGLPEIASPYLLREQLLSDP